MRLPYHGYPEQGFRESGKTFLGIGSNPSTASVLTNLNKKTRRSHNPGNSDRIYLNGISLEIVEDFPDGSIKVRVTYEDNLIEKDRRWSAPEIVLNNHVKNNDDLVVKAKLTLDRGQTLTRFTKPDTLGGRVYFSSPTVLRVKEGASLRINDEMILLKKSELIIEEGGHLIIAKKGKLTLKDRASVRFDRGSKISGKGKIRMKDNAEARVRVEMEKQVRKRTCQKRKVKVSGVLR